MPTPAYLSIEGSTQGNITEGAFTEDSVGNIYQEGHENEILVENSSCKKVAKMKFWRSEKIRNASNLHFFDEIFISS